MDTLSQVTEPDKQKSYQQVMKSKKHIKNMKKNQSLSEKLLVILRNRQQF